MPSFQKPIQSVEQVGAAWTTGPVARTLPWDFCDSFPQPLTEAIAAEKLGEGDRNLENLKAIHDDYLFQGMTILTVLGVIIDAKRGQFDPRTGAVPQTLEERKMLDMVYEDEPARLQHVFNMLMDEYAETFGLDASKALRTFLRSRLPKVEATIKEGR